MTRCTPTSAETAGHTPTPWHFDELEGGRRDGCGYIRCDVDHLEISHHGDMGRSREENLANAAFIVEAVNNYASLQSRLSAQDKRVEELEKALRKADDYAKTRHNANIGWWNDPLAWELVENVIKPILARAALTDGAADE